MPRQITSMMPYPNKICLVGFMGVGKTTFGKKIAKYLDYTFVDTDQEIENRIGKSVSDIFSELGEPFFREQESILLKELLASNTQLVISTGGGIGGNLEHMNLMTKKAKVVFLYLNIKSIYQRISQNNTRPLLANLNEAESMVMLSELYSKRLPVYLQSSIFINSLRAKQLTKQDVVTLLNNS